MCGTQTRNPHLRRSIKKCLQVGLCEYCVVKLVNDNKDSDQITLLSFGGSRRHTLMMKYVSVWSNISNGSNKSSNYNEWIPVTDNHNNPIIIGRAEMHYYHGMRAVVGGSNNHLLFITYYLNHISVFDLNTFQFIKHDNLPADNHVHHHCFVSNSANGHGQEMMKTNKQNYQMLLFYQNTGLSIEYDEDNNTFQFHQLLVCDDIAKLSNYAYVCVNDIILFFGGWNDDKCVFSKSVHKYSIKEKKWTKFENTLPGPLCHCTAVLNKNSTYIHIIGGQNKNSILSTHMKTEVHVWDPSQLSKKEIKFAIQYWIRISEIKLGWIDDFDKIVMKYIRT
ncbi:hypothetical protein RFI_27480 [Reticulomyxa filosa]|uniref:Kelch motif family protein n=1 Tax=Reticulomyxa filosa TaxID=46433 RepID=X6M8W8_RETFI|nr:hypothetical protein RFI_27480 [Reticulomyxa filosa]|eukprot:ETO09897.1 hypothetical protein RFI_27480 [Reticulomyxa filosa]